MISAIILLQGISIIFLAVGISLISKRLKAYEAQTDYALHIAEVVLNEYLRQEAERIINDKD